jgi:uncharacterized protein (TIGR02453 family)
MAWFTEAYLHFFMDLASNNHRDWFHGQKNRYESEVKKPFLYFMEALMSKVEKIDPRLVTDPSKTLFRINRDVRFSKDKAPYKLHMAAVLSPEGKKDPGPAAFYLQFGVENIMLAGGLYSPTPFETSRVRLALADHSTEWEKAISSPTFQTLYGEIQGERLKKRPKELKEVEADFPDVYRKQWYFQSTLEAETHLTNPQLLEITCQHFLAGYPVFEKLHQFYHGK